jgi:hypothetical protein
MKFSREIIPLMVTSTSYLLIPQIQPFQCEWRSNFSGGCNTCISQRGTIKFSMLKSSKDEQPFLWETKTTNVEGDWKLKLLSWFVRKFMNRCTYINKIWYNKRSWTYLQVLFEWLFYLTKLLNTTMVRKFEVMLRLTLNHSVEFCNFVQYHIIFATYVISP